MLAVYVGFLAPIEVYLDIRLIIQVGPSPRQVQWLPENIMFYNFVNSSLGSP